MSSSPTVVAAASTLATWAHERRRTWSADPLPRPLPRMAAAPEPVVVPVPPLIPVVVPVPVVAHERVHEFPHEAVELRFNDVVEAPPMELPSPSTPVSALDVVRVVARTVGAILVGGFERVRPLGEPAVEWLMRGAAVVSTMSVLLLVGVNRGEVAARWDQTAAMATAAATSAASSATNHFADAPPPPGPAKGSGRVNISSPSGAAQVVIDGKPRGVSPLTVDLTAGAHRVVLKSEKGSVERSLRVEAGETADVDEAIFPGWLAVTAAIDLTLSEGGRALGRDERGWTILAPGPHDVHFTNRALGVHEVRHVFVKPGEATWLSLVPQTSR